MNVEIKCPPLPKCSACKGKTACVEDGQTTTPTRVYQLVRCHACGKNDSIYLVWKRNQVLKDLESRSAV